MKGHAGDIQGLDTGFVQIVPDLDEPVVSSRHRDRACPAVVVVHAVNTLVGEVVSLGPELPNLHRLVQGGQGEGVVVLGVDHDHHDVVGVPLEDLLATPVLVPVPEL